MHADKDEEYQVASADGSRSGASLALAVEIGGRGQRVSVVTRHGRVVTSVNAIGHEQTAANTVETICGLIEQLLVRRQVEPWEFRGIGVAFGGPVDAERGITIRSHRMAGFEHFPLASMLEDRFGIRTIIENDARAAALGEYTLGAGRGARDMVYIYLGSGVGGAVIIDGRVQHGASMTSGEIGHIVVAPDGPRCSCGKPGHLEAYASELAIITRMFREIETTQLVSAVDWAADPGVTVERIFQEYENDDRARRVVDETVHVIGLAAANLVTALNPDAVVIGGYVADAGSMLTAAVRAKIRQYAFDAAARRVAVAAAQLGADAGIVGAAVLALSD